MILRGRYPIRGGFTLIEVLVASAITVLLMGALYVAMDMQLREMDEGRTAVEESTLGNRIASRIASDITSSVGPVVPAGSSSSSAGTGGTSSTAGAVAATPTTSGTALVNFQIGVKGSQNSLSVFTTRLTRNLVTPPDDPSGATPPVVCDVWRVTYFLGDNGQGLVKQEIRQPTADLVDDVPTSVDDHTRVLAGEVTELTFRYYDGTSFQDSWDGSQPGPDGVTPMGPPQAVEVTIVVQSPSTGKQTKYVHVVSLPAAPGPSSSSSSSTTSP
ncbi:MAG: prepilin-type N-terminal cleavage/methylation domain-containing protein [Gemmataceae bacterium]